uniref:Uncharacterized protein n=1 Tax=Candidatus Kentrum sp. LFY TaxID=2126342 RepID=A0A450U8W6_9GAMM|nr:MAG: hypothetical protein BECKLFY1418B_GA0070995_101013 [Candidatus Kentron sp. LFY]
MGLGARTGFLGIFGFPISNPAKPEPKHLDDAIVNPSTPLSSRPKGEIFRLGGHPEREGFLAQRKMTNHRFLCVFLEIFRVRAKHYV